MSIFKSKKITKPCVAEGCRKAAIAGLRYCSFHVKLLKKEMYQKGYLEYEQPPPPE